MTEKEKSLTGIKTVLLILFLVTLIYYGIGLLFFPRWVFELFGLAIPPSFIWVRALGCMALGMSVGLWLAYRDPLKNTAVILMGIVATALTAALFFLAILKGVLPASEWVDVILLAVVCLLLIYFYPRGR